MNPNPEDLLLQRYLDGELDAAARAACDARLLTEPQLRQRLDSLRGFAAGFAAMRAEGRRAPAGFTAAVVAAARRLPSRQELQQADVTAGAVAFCRRLLLAAAILTVGALGFHFGLFRHQPSTLQATPDEVQQEMDRLDSLVTGAAASEAKGHRGK
ncbi:MAG: hypothetical protein IT455_15610 [Planctomycetes bacterium]|nr:hypothetical protein [Planctomycetota bacterium]